MNVRIVGGAAAAITNAPLVSRSRNICDPLRAFSYFQEMKQPILFVLAMVPFLLCSQVENDSIHTEIYDSSVYFDWPHNEEYLSFGLYPEVQYIRGPVVGISASVAKVMNGGHGAVNDLGINVGFDYAPIQRFYGPKLSLWADSYSPIFFIPMNATVNLTYYFQEDKKGLYCRPEIGIGIPRLHLKYGFGFRLAGDQLMGVAGHSIALGYHINLGRKLMW